MKLDLKNVSLTISGFVSRCQCKCNHCLMSSGSKDLPYISYNELKEFSERFIGFRDKYGIYVQMAAYCSCEFDELADSILVNKRLNFPIAGYLNLNGTAIRKGNELIEWVQYLKSIGMTNANISWFGVNDTHDSFVNRKGYYDYLKDLIAAIYTEKVPTSNSIFITRSNIGELKELISTLDAYGGHNEYCLAEYRGYAKDILGEYLTESDISRIPNEIVESGALENYKPEYEWVKRISNGNYPTLSKRIMFLVTHPDNLVDYMQMSWEEVLIMFEKMDSQLLEAIPSFEFLAQNYGDDKSNILYNFRSILWKWIDNHFEVNPQLDKNLLFSDLKSGIFWK